MTAPSLLAMGAAAVAMLSASGAEAQQPHMIGGGPRSPPPGSPGRFHGGGFHGGQGFFFPFYFEREVPVIVEREVVREVPVVVEPPPPPPPPRKPYRIGASYASLPGGCMKSIEDGGRSTFYLCSGDWYQQVGSGSGATYKAVARR